MSEPIGAVIFDFEGTLVDFQWRLAAAESELCAAFAAQGYDTRGNYAELWNAAAQTALAKGRLAALRGALGPVYDRWDADALARWTPRPGAAELLEALAGKGVRTCMVSNIGHAALTAALARFGFDRWLTPVISRDAVNFMKPLAEGTLRALAESGTPPTQALFVGDSRADVLAARAAGLRVAIVRGGECPESDFDALPPDWMISRLAEIADLVAASRPPDTRVGGIARQL